MKHIHFCILTWNEKENSSDSRSDCIHVTIISNQCCILGAGVNRTELSPYNYKPEA